MMQSPSSKQNKTLRQQQITFGFDWEEPVELPVKVMVNRMPVLQNINTNERNRKTFAFLFFLSVLVLSFIDRCIIQQRHLNSNQLQPQGYQGDELIGASTTMLLGIFSMTKDKAIARRDLVRKTWIKKGTTNICSLQQYIEQEEVTFNSKTQHQTLCKVIYTFVIGAGDDSRPTDHLDYQPLTLKSDINGNTEDDCTYLNIKENMEDGKTTSYLKWAAEISKRYSFDYVGKIDDDTVMWTPMLLEFIDEDLPPAPYNRRIYGGHLVNAFKKARYLGDYVSHFYPEGQFYYMSMDLAAYISYELPISTRQSLTYNIEDLDVGAYVASHTRPIKIIQNTSIFWIHPAKDIRAFRNAWWRLLAQMENWRPVMKWDHYCWLFEEREGMGSEIDMYSLKFTETN